MSHINFDVIKRFLENFKNENNQKEFQDVYVPANTPTISHPNLFRENFNLKVAAAAHNKKFSF